MNDPPKMHNYDYFYAEAILTCLVVEICWICYGCCCLTEASVKQKAGILFAEVNLTKLYSGLIIAKVGKDAVFSVPS